MSPDGHYSWNGTAWVPAAPGQPGLPAKKGHMVRNLGIGCLGLLVLIVIIVVATNASKNSPSTSTPATSAAPKTAQVLLDLPGSGTKTTAKFTASGDWDLNWTYDCANFGQAGNFAVLVYSGGGSLSSNSPVNQLGTKGADVEHYHTGGTFYLVVNSECTWHITAKG